MFTPESAAVWALNYIISLGANLTIEAGKKFINLFKDKPDLSEKLEEITLGTLEGISKDRLKVDLYDAFNGDASLLREVFAFAKNVNAQILNQEGSGNIGIQERRGVNASQIMNQKGDNNRGRQSSS